MAREQLVQKMRDEKIIAIVRGVAARDMLAVAEALLAGGISLLEITFDQKSDEGRAETLRSLAVLKEKMDGRISLGAGTVMTVGQVEDARRCGVEYIISPNVDSAVIARTRELDMVSMPGALTPSEIAAAHNAGADIVKLFPAGLWGAGYIKAVRGPLAHIPLAAVGGVEPGNVGEFFRAGACCVGVGGNLVSVKEVAAGNFQALTAVAAAFRKELNHIS